MALEGASTPAPRRPDASEQMRVKERSCSGRRGEVRTASRTLMPGSLWSRVVLMTFRASMASRWCALSYSVSLMKEIVVGGVIWVKLAGTYTPVVAEIIASERLSKLDRAERSWKPA